MKRKNTDLFFNTHPVFSLEEAVVNLNPTGGKEGTIERLKYHISSGKLKSVIRGVYAVIPPNLPPDSYVPDPYLITVASRPNCVFAYHGALEILGAAHSSWKNLIVFTETPRREFFIGDFRIKFLPFPKILKSKNSQKIGTKKIERLGKWLVVTGEERTLVEGFRNPLYMGGLEELIQSAGGFPVLDLNLLYKILSIYNTSRLWIATGWFLESFQNSFHVSEEYLLKMEKHKPRSPTYMVRNQRGGTFSKRWNLIIPENISKLGEYYAA